MIVFEVDGVKALASVDAQQVRAFELDGAVYDTQVPGKPPMKAPFKDLGDMAYALGYAPEAREDDPPAKWVSRVKSLVRQVRPEVSRKKEVQIERPKPAMVSESSKPTDPFAAERALEQDIERRAVILLRSRHPGGRAEFSMKAKDGKLGIAVYEKGKMSPAPVDPREPGGGARSIARNKWAAKEFSALLDACRAEVWDNHNRATGA